MRSGRFLPPDPRVEEPYRVTPQLALRIGILGALTLVVFAVLFLRLWALQVLSGSEYARAAQNNQLRTIRLESRRGAILDRDGQVLVTNVPGTAVRIWPADLPKKGRYQQLRRLSRILRVPLPRIVAEIEKRKGDPVTPVTVKARAREAEVLYLYERQEQFPGVEIHKTYLRDYRAGPVAAHVLGYVGEISKEELEANPNAGYRAGDRIGQAGIEAAYDRYLRGRSGVAQLRVDSLGHPQSDLVTRQSPQSGNSIRLTLDLDLQRAAERSLHEWIGNAQRQGGDCFGCWSASGGAIVALDPRNGAVRALASYPDFDPRLYTEPVDPRDLARAGLKGPSAERRNFPALNRATMASYPPGSTFKPVTALAAMEERLIAPYDPLLCDGQYEAYGQIFRNWTLNVYQWMTLPDALEASCDTYFYRVGEMFYKLPEEYGQPLQKWASRFGFGKRTGLDIGGESTGLLPTIAWRKQHFRTEIERSWKPGHSIQLAIGQADLEVTPLQLTRFYAMVANGGKLVTPYLAAQVEQPGSGNAEGAVLRTFAPRRPQPVGVDAAALHVVRDGLYQATHGSSGTATLVFGNFPVDIAGKTGTAEKAVVLPGFSYAALVDQSWFCGYGPVRRPELVVCALIENGGHGGAIAAPAALRVFERYFGVKSTFQPQETD